MEIHIFGRENGLAVTVDPDIGPTKYYVFNQVVDMIYFLSNLLGVTYTTPVIPSNFESEPE